MVTLASVSSRYWFRNINIEHTSTGEVVCTSDRRNRDIQLRYLDHQNNRDISITKIIIRLNNREIISSDTRLC